MELKLLQSKINLLTAQLNQLIESGLFSDEEITRLSRPLKIEMAQIQPKLNEMLASLDASDFEVNGHEILS
jgi:hypothetical protein